MHNLRAVIKTQYENGQEGYAFEVKMSRGVIMVRTCVSCRKHRAFLLPIPVAFKVMKDREERFPDTRYCMEIVDD